MIVLYDTPSARLGLYPFSLTRPIGALQLGCHSLQDWWSIETGMEVALLSELYLSAAPLLAANTYWAVDATVLPSANLLAALIQLHPGQRLVHPTAGLIAYCTSKAPEYNVYPNIGEDVETSTLPALTHGSQLFILNEMALRLQLKGRASAIPTRLHPSNMLICPEQISIAPSAKLIATTINASDGPVFIGPNANLMEGCILHGPVSVGEGAVVKMGAKLYPGTSVGAFCVIGGEVKNSIIMPFSNKAHDGYLGDSVIGSWCNLGAGTTNSNVKNTASEVSMWHQGHKQNVKVGLKAGLLLGDYSRTAINTAFNTGTIIGACCNIFGQVYPPPHLSSFSWGYDQTYNPEKALEHINNWMQLKGQQLSTRQAMILRHIFGAIAVTHTIYKSPGPTFNPYEEI